MPTMSAASTPSRSVIMKAWSIYEDPAILKMNFNFNFKDMPRAAGPSIRWVTKTRDLHHTGKLWGGMVLTRRENGRHPTYAGREVETCCLWSHQRTIVAQGLPCRRRLSVKTPVPCLAN